MEKNAAPLDYFLHAYGPAARPTMHLDWVFTGIVLLVCLTIVLLLVIAIVRRRPPAKAGEIMHGDSGMRFIAIGTGISTCVLLGMAVYMLVTLNDVSRPPKAPALTIKVTAYDWWWKVDYDGFETANEIHIPVGVPVLIELKSADVIHAFWVPQLAGKTQAIPGLVNRQWIEADQPGTYRGQCTQFCGAQHAHMAFEVVAESPKIFQAWEEAQRQAAVSDPDAAAGQEFFMKNCAGCHSVRGTNVPGGHAPDLTHFLSRRLIGAGTLVNSQENAMRWIANVQEIKPGARMPDFELPPQEASVLSAYLSTLK